MRKKLSLTDLPQCMADQIKELYQDKKQDKKQDINISLIVKAHRSGDLVYQIGNKYILKISEQFDRLKREKDANDYLLDKLPVSKSVMYIEENGKAYYLKTRLIGKRAMDKTYLKDPGKLARLLAEAVHMVHSIDTTDCKLKNQDSEGDCFIHGDFCLPNIMLRYNHVAGFIDTEACGLGDPWMDYAWCIWSFEYNLGTKEYTPLLLEALGITFDQEKFDYYTPHEDVSHLIP